MVAWMWLFVNLPTAMLAAWVVRRCGGTIAGLAVLLACALIGNGQGGNVQGSTMLG